MAYTAADMSLLVESRHAGYLVSGFSLAGEETVVAVPELDVVFDIGKCPREALAVNTLAVSHGHMDHAAGLAYYCSQRNFVGQATPRVVCHPRLVDPFNKLLDCWAAIEGHRAPAQIIGLEPGKELELRRGLFLRAFAVNHHGHALGYVVIERRSKLKPEFMGEDGQPKFTGAELVKIKESGTSITYEVELPLVCYCGDTAPGPFLDMPIVNEAKLLLIECTFFEPEHVRRAKEGKHMHVRDLAGFYEQLDNEAIVLLHVTRRTGLGYAKRQLKYQVGQTQAYHRTAFLMDRPKKPKPSDAALATPELLNADEPEPDPALRSVAE